MTIMTRTAEKTIRIGRYYKHRYIFLLLAPGLIYFLLFRIAPMWGLLLAFKDFTPYTNFWESPWVGFKYFNEFFTTPRFIFMLRNTMAISLLNIFFYFPLPILLALLINECRSLRYKKIVQTIVYLPHFLSWVVITGLSFALLSVDIGAVNKLILESGGTPIKFLSTPSYFWWVILLQNIWREMGWGSILFLAAISQIDPNLYEAAEIDGASRIRRIMHITLPSILPTIITMFILRLGSILEVGLEQIMLMWNLYVHDVAEVFDFFTYKVGIENGNYSIGVTVGIFKGIAAMILVLASDRIIKRMGHDGIL